MKEKVLVELNLYKSLNHLFHLRRHKSVMRRYCSYFRQKNGGNSTSDPGLLRLAELPVGDATLTTLLP